MSNLKTAYSSQLNEGFLSNLKVEGDIPLWLSGNFISNGPAQFEVGDTKFKHWLDGFAMLKKFTFHDGAVSFNNRFLRSKQYVDSVENNKLYFNEFTTYADNSSLMRVVHSLRSLIKGEMYDNCSVNTTQIANQYIAMTETNEHLAFDLETLQTQGKFHFSEPLKGEMSLAHPQLDIASGDMINLTIEIGKDVKYHLYKVVKGSTRQVLLTTYKTDKLFYMHSFSLTPNYIILYKSPLKGDRFKLLLACPFNDTLTWDKKASSIFVMINRQTGEIKEIETEPFISLHSVNAFDRANEIVLDLICHHDANPYDTLYLSNLTSPEPKYNRINLKRYVVDMSKNKVSHTVLLEKKVEFPQINYRHANGMDYQFAYMTVMTTLAEPIFNAVQKINVNTGVTQCWEKKQYYPGEPIFIQKPGSVIEDEGVLLSIGFNAQNNLSSLVILDAQNMQQRAEILLPFSLPFGLHGRFYKK